MAPALLELPRRFWLPPEARGDGSIPLEMHRHALYSAVAFNTAVLPQELEFFSYLVGQTVTGAGAGAITATRFHTNANAVRTIAKPKTFTIFGFRIIIPPLTYGTNPSLTEDTTLAAVAANNQFEDLLMISETGVFEFKIGEKTYCECPIRRMPGNTGLGGVTATSVSNTNAAVLVQNHVALHTNGIGYDMTGEGSCRPPVLWNQQSFSAKLLFQWATNYTPKRTGLIFLWLDGVEGREIQ